MKKEHYRYLFFVLICSVIFIVSTRFLNLRVPQTIEGLFRATVNIIYDQELKSRDLLSDKIVIVEPVTGNLLGIVDTIQKKKPKLIVLDFLPAQEDMMALQNQPNIIYPIESDDSQVALVIGSVTIGYEGYDVFNQMILEKIGIRKKWYHNKDIPIRLFGTDDKFGRVKSNEPVNGKVVIIGFPIDPRHPEEDGVKTTIGTISRTTFLANEIFTLIEYGLEKKSIVIEYILYFFLVILFCIFLNEEILVSYKFRSTIIITMSIVILLVTIVMLFIHFNIFIHPLHCFIMPLDYVLAVWISKKVMVR
jgi:hypothetical protein